MRYCNRCRSIYQNETQYCPADGSLLEVRDEFEIGTKVKGRYEIISHLGSGNMADVFLVRDEMLYSGTLRAMKVPKARFAADIQYIAKFKDEANKAILLNHKKIVRSFHLDETDSGLPLLLMEFVEGESLRWWMDRDPKLQWRHAIEIAQQIAEALESAHADGVVHCDIKPENVKAVGKNNPTPLKVLDFGLGKATEALLQKLKGAGHGTVWGGDVVAGTYEYMAPEQAVAREKVGPPSDIYSLGVVLYEMLTGTVPFRGIASAEEARRTHQEQSPATLRDRGDLPGGLAGLVEEMLSRSPEHRPSASEVVQRLNALENTVPPPVVKDRSHVGLVATGVGVVLGLVLILAWPRTTSPGDSYHAPAPNPPNTVTPTLDQHVDYFGSKPKAQADTSNAVMARLIVSCDSACNWELDGSGEKGAIPAGGSVTVPFASGGAGTIRATASGEEYRGIAPQSQRFNLQMGDKKPIDFRFEPALTARNKAEEIRKQQVADNMRTTDALPRRCGGYQRIVNGYKSVLALQPPAEDEKVAKDKMSEAVNECEVLCHPCDAHK